MNREPEATTFEFDQEETGQDALQQTQVSTREVAAPDIRVTLLPDPNALDGVPLDLTGRRISMTFTDDAKKADTMALRLLNHDLHFFDAQYSHLDTDRIIEVSWGYPGRMTSRRMVIKKITGFEQLTITGRALSYLMNQETKTRGWKGLRRSDVVGEIANEYGYGEAAQIEDSVEVIDYINQARETDAHFLTRLAQREGFLFYVDDTGLHWHAKDKSSAPTHTFYWRGDGTGHVLSASISSDWQSRPIRVRLKGKNPKTGEEFEVEAGATTESDRDTLGERIGLIDGERGELTYARRGAKVEETVLKARRPYESGGRSEAAHAPISEDITSAPTKEQAQRQAEATYRRAEDGITWTLGVIGDPSIRAKTIVELLGVGERFEGNHYVEEVRHNVEGGSYTCTLKLVRDATGRRARDIGPQSAKKQGGTLNDQRGPGVPSNGEDKPKEPFRKLTIDSETGKARVQWSNDKPSD